jgi:hypothetical protein
LRSADVAGPDIGRTVAGVEISVGECPTDIEHEIAAAGYRQAARAAQPARCRQDDIDIGHVAADIDTDIAATQGPEVGAGDEIEVPGQTAGKRGDGCRVQAWSV